MMDHQTLDHTRLARSCVAAATSFFDARPWVRVDEDDLLVCRLPDEVEPLVAAILGSAGRPYGLLVLRGPWALTEMRRVGAAKGPRIPFLAPMLAVTLESRRRIEAPWIGLLDAAGHSRPMGPLFLARDPEAPIRLPTGTELLVLGRVLRALARGYVRGHLQSLLEALAEQRGRHPLLRVSGRLPQVKVEFGVFHRPTLPSGAGAERKADPPGPNPQTWSRSRRITLDPPTHLVDLPRLARKYVVALRQVPGPGLAGDRGLHAVVVLDPASGAHQVELLRGPDLHVASACVYAVLAGQSPGLPRGWPARITFEGESLYRAMRDGLVARGVLCTSECVVPDLEGVCTDPGRILDPRAQIPAPPARVATDGGVVADGPVDGSGGLAAEVAIDVDVVPAADDLEGWRALAVTVSNGILDAVRATDEDAPHGLAARAWRTYFGASRDGVPARGDGEDETTMTMTMTKWMSFCEWRFFEFRQRKTGATIAEALLQTPLPAGVATILRARAAAMPSIYRLTNIVTGECVDLVDILDGRRVTIHDEVPSFAGYAGMAAVLRVYRAGDFWFGTPAGPTIEDAFAARAVIHLEEDVGLDLADDTGRRRDGHLLGRLWRWKEMFYRRRSVERDLHERLHRPRSAGFSVNDPSACAAALDAREEMLGDDVNQWYWTERRPLALGPARLGVLTLIGSELVLEVDTVENLCRGRELLETLPGVRFVSSRERGAHPAGSRSRPLDDVLLTLEADQEDEIDARDLILVRDRMRQIYFRWLDVGIPILDGKSPRDACSTPEGRRAVQRLIRAYPDPGRFADWTVPREEMLAELGLT